MYVVVVVVVVVVAGGVDTHTHTHMHAKGREVCVFSASPTHAGLLSHTQKHTRAHSHTLTLSH